MLLICICCTKTCPLGMLPIWSWNDVFLVFLNSLSWDSIEKNFASVFIWETCLWFLSGYCVLLRTMLDLGGDSTLTSSLSVSWDSVRNIGNRLGKIWQLMHKILGSSLLRSF